MDELSEFFKNVREGETGPSLATQHFLTIKQFSFCKELTNHMHLCRLFHQKQLIRPKTSYMTREIESERRIFVDFSFLFILSGRLSDPWHGLIERKVNDKWNVLKMTGRCSCRSPTTKWISCLFRVCNVYKKW